MGFHALFRLFQQLEGFGVVGLFRQNRAEVALHAGEIVVLNIDFDETELDINLLFAAFGLLIASVAGVFAGAAIANTLAIRIYERGRLPGIGLQWNAASARALLLGAGGGIAAGLIAVLLPAAAGLASWQAAAGGPESNSSFFGFIFLTAMLLFGAVGEEMLFRGYGLQVLVPWLGPMAAILPMSVLFAAAHADNQNISWLGLFRPRR